MSKAVLQSADELAQAIGEVSQSVEVGPPNKRVTVKIKPFGLRQLARVLACVQKMRDAGAIEKDAPAAFVRTVKDAGSGEEAAEQATRSFDMGKMFLAGAEQIINILQIAAAGQISSQVLDNLNPVDGARLAAAVIAVNVDFFYQHREQLQAALAPAVEVISNVAANGVEALGQPPSTDSSEQDTP